MGEYYRSGTQIFCVNYSILSSPLSHETLQLLIYFRNEETKDLKIFKCHIKVVGGVRIGTQTCVIRFCVLFFFFLKQFFKKLIKKFYSLALLGLYYCAQAASRCGEWGLLSSCSARASHCCGFSCCRAHSRACRASNCGMLA